jgi:hypothetical protein
MARATTCIFNGKLISVAKAISIKETAPVRERKFLGFECLECGMPVNPHRAGGNAAAHFEHFDRNPNCKLSDPAR